MKKTNFNLKAALLVFVCVAPAFFVTGCQMSLGTAFTLGAATGENLVMILFLTVAVIVGYFEALSFVPWAIFIAGVVIQAFSLIGRYRKYAGYEALGFENPVKTSIARSLLIAAVFLAIMCLVRSRGKKRIVRQIQKSGSTPPKEQKDDDSAFVIKDPRESMFEFNDDADTPNSKKDGGRPY